MLKDIASTEFVSIIISLIAVFFSITVAIAQRTNNKYNERITQYKIKDIERLEYELKKYIEKENMYEEYLSNNYVDNHNIKNDYYYNNRIDNNVLDELLIYNRSIRDELTNIEIKLSKINNENISKSNDRSRDILKWEDKIKYLRYISAELSHSIKTPLSALELSIDRIEEDLNIENIDSIEKNIKLAKANLMNLKEIMQVYKNLSNDVKDILKKDDKELIDLKSSIKNITELAVLGSPKKVNLNIKCENIINVTKYDFNKMYLAINNIIDNAIYELKDNGIIDLKINKINNDVIEIKIWNNGDEIPDNIIRKIFDAEFSNKGSSGLGLSISKEIIENEFNGSIVASNKIKDDLKGVEFTIRIKI